jgi:hypothetical protein
MQRKKRILRVMKVNKTESLKPVGAWAEVAPDGELLFCYAGKKHGKRFEQKLSRKEIDEFLKNYPLQQLQSFSDRAKEKVA